MDETACHLSPDGRYAVILVSEEMRMSHWADSPVIISVADNAALLNLSASLWSADTVRWSPDSRHVTLALRCYPGDAPGVTTALSPDARTATVESPPSKESMSLAQVLPWLEAYYERHRRTEQTLA